MILNRREKDNKAKQPNGYIETIEKGIGGIFGFYKTA